MAITISLEKVFFKYFLENKQYYEKVLPSYFGNPDLKFVYNIIREYMINNDSVDTPKPRQIAEMVFLADKTGQITKQLLIDMLRNDISDYDVEKFIKPKLKFWVLSNKLADTGVDVVDITRSIDSAHTLDELEEISNKLKHVVDEATKSTLDDDDDLGTDFDDHEEHAQDLSNTKVSTGWPALDTSLGGGFDIKTLNILMAETNGGKCIAGDMLIKIRNKKTNKMEDIMISDFLSKIYNSHNKINK